MSTAEKPTPPRLSMATACKNVATTGRPLYELNRKTDQSPREDPCDLFGQRTELRSLQEALRILNGEDIGFLQRWEDDH